jgi:hypothetical protein
MSVFRRVKGQELQLGMRWEFERYFAPIIDKTTGQKKMVPMKKKIGPFYNHVFVWTGSFWCPKTRFQRWSGTEKLEQINQRYADRPTYFVDKVFGTNEDGSSKFG